MRLTSETVILKAQGPVGKRKDRSVISRYSHEEHPPWGLCLTSPNFEARIRQQSIHSGSFLPSSTLPRPSVHQDLDYPFKTV